MILIAVGAIWLVWYLSRNNANSSNIDSALSQRNRDWFSYISSFQSKAKTKDQKKLIEEMLIDIKNQGLVDSGIVLPTNTQLDITDPIVDQYIETDVQLPLQPTTAVTTLQPAQPSIELDNASLLLYFGAFLFVASAGLFVAFSGVGGILKAISVYVVAMALYITGCWLYKNKKQFTQVGIAFAGIGMSILPLMGLAIYKYVLNSQNGSIAWFIASLLSLSVFGHAVWYFRKPFLNYVLIFTSLSLFESAISIIDVPIYCFGWVMATLSLILLALSLYKNIWLDFRESALYSSQIILPISMISSLVLIQKSGALQLGISLTIGCFYYLLQAFTNKDLKDVYSTITHTLVLCAVSTFAYAVEPSWHFVSIVVLVTNIVQLLLFLLFSRKTDFWLSWSTLLLVYLVVGVFMASGSANLVISSIVLAVICSYAMWLKVRQNWLFVVGAVGLSIFALAFGQYYLASVVTPALQTTLLTITITLQLAIYLAGRRISTEAGWDILATLLLVGSALFVAIFSLAVEGLSMFAYCYYIALIVGIMAIVQKESKWAMFIGGLVSLPVIGSSIHIHYLALAVILALLVNIALAIKYRYEFNRWLGSFLWFIIPITFDKDVFAGDFTVFNYSLAYLIVFTGFVLSRSIARGLMFVSAKVPLSTYSKSASMSYVVGYVLSAIVSTVLAVTVSSNSLFLVFVLALITLATFLIAIYIEKQKEILLLIPFMLQAIIWAMLRSTIEQQGTMLTFGIVSTILAGVSYMLAYDYLPRSKNWAQLVTASTLATLYITPFTVVFSQSTWVMPVGLFVATIATYVNFKHTNQNNRELICMLGLGSIYWLLWHLGVREVQVYNHLMVAIFAGFAYWRYQRHELEQSKTYIYILLAVATIPLTIQAVAGQAGGLYGWWLILEQIVFIIIGMSIKNGVMIRWGLYVAVGAVLYQLRHLGWAALTLLAVFVIGLAIYKIQHSNKS